MFRGSLCGGRFGFLGFYRACSLLSVWSWGSGSAPEHAPEPAFRNLGVQGLEDLGPLPLEGCR